MNHQKKKLKIKTRIDLQQEKKIDLTKIFLINKQKNTFHLI